MDESDWFENHLEWHPGNWKIRLRYERKGQSSVKEEFHPNGQLKHREEKLNGKLNGLYFSYYDNGVKKEMGEYENGYWKGKWLYYNPDGSVQSYKCRM